MRKWMGGREDIGVDFTKYFAIEEGIIFRDFSYK
jgi:hypothetical protein